VSGGPQVGVKYTYRVVTQPTGPGDQTDMTEQTAISNATGLVSFEVRRNCEIEIGEYPENPIHSIDVPNVATLAIKKFDGRKLGE